MSEKILIGNESEPSFPLNNNYYQRNDNENSTINKCYQCCSPMFFQRKRNLKRLWGLATTTASSQNQEQTDQMPHTMSSATMTAATSHSHPHHPHQKCPRSSQPTKFDCTGGCLCGNSNGDGNNSDCSTTTTNTTTAQYHLNPATIQTTNLYQLFYALTKKLKEAQVETLCQAVKYATYDGQTTNCVLVPRLLIEGQDPHVIACRLWRWPDLRYAIELKRIPSCPNEIDPVYVCCNPTHWYRICRTDSPPPPYSLFAMERLKPEDRAPSEKRVREPSIFPGSLSTDGEASCKNAFKPPNDCDYPYWDYVFNCAAETRLGKSDAIYQEGIYKLSLNCINEAIAHNVNRYIEFSSGNMFSSDKRPIDENCERKPWTKVAQQKARVEEELENRKDEINYTILRLPLVYGIGDQKGLAFRLVIAALYKHLNEKMKLLWDESMKMNTIHVDDVVAAAFFLAQNQLSNKQCYNLVDDSQSTQGTISNILANIFNIKVGYWGEGLSNLANLKVPISVVVEEINDKHMEPWAEICIKDNTQNTPLTPFMDSELLQHCHLNLSNGKLKDTGYRLKVPIMTQESVEEIVNDYVKQKLLPASLLY